MKEDDEVWKKGCLLVGRKKEENNGGGTFIKRITSYPCRRVNVLDILSFSHPRFYIWSALTPLPEL